MKKFHILTSGEKIKEIRSRFNIKQEELTGGEITRNLISIIENNKANLTEPVANILVENINKICSKRNIDFCVTKDYLLEDIISQAKNLAIEYIDYINSLKNSEINKISDKLNEIDVFLKLYKTEEKKADLYRAIAKKFMDCKNYPNAIDYYLSATRCNMKSIA